MRAIDALRHRDFVILLIGRLLISTGLQMRLVARGWLVYELTESALALMWVASARAIAVFFVAPIGGVLTDRLDKRLVVLIGRLVMAVNSGVIAALVLTGHIQVWHLAVSSIIDGFRGAFTMPANNSIVADLVPREHIMNAFSVLAVGGSLMGIVGAATAGLLIEWVGPGRVFVVMSVLFTSVALIYLWLPETRSGGSGPQVAIWRAWLSGVQHVRARPALMLVLGLTFVRMCLVAPYTTLLPAFAVETLGMSAVGLGWLTSMRLLGATVFSVLMSAQGNRGAKGRLLLQTGLVVGAALLLFVGIPWAPAAFILIAVVGGADQASMIISQTLTQTETEPEFRGRVTSLRQNLDGIAPAIRLPASALADQIGVPPVVAIQAALVMLIYGGVWLWRPQFHKLR